MLIPYSSQNGFIYLSLCLPHSPAQLQIVRSNNIVRCCHPAGTPETIQQFLKYQVLEQNRLKTNKGHNVLHYKNHIPHSIEILGLIFSQFREVFQRSAYVQRKRTNNDVKL
jgi:hypothetical protein